MLCFVSVHVQDVASSETTDAMEEHRLLPDYAEQQVGPAMVNQENFHHTNFDR